MENMEITNMYGMDLQHKGLLEKIEKQMHTVKEELTKSYDATCNSLRAEVSSLRHENKLLVERIEKLEANMDNKSNHATSAGHQNDPILVTEEEKSGTEHDMTTDSSRSNSIEREPIKTTGTGQPKDDRPVNGMGNMDGVWQCGECAMINHPIMPLCEQCEHPRFLVEEDSTGSDGYCSEDEMIRQSPPSFPPESSEAVKKKTKIGGKVPSLITANLERMKAFADGQGNVGWEAAKTGDVAARERLLLTHPHFHFVNAADAPAFARSTQNFEMAEWVAGHYLEAGGSHQVAEAALLHGDVRTLRWFHQESVLNFKDLALLTNGVSTNFDSAVGRGHLEVAQFLLEAGYPGLTPQAWVLAGGRGHVGALRWLATQTQTPYERTAMAAAAGAGRLAAVEFLHSTELRAALAGRAAGGPGGGDAAAAACSPYAAAAAAQEGNTAVLEFLGRSCNVCTRRLHEKGAGGGGGGRGEEEEEGDTDLDSEDCYDSEEGECYYHSDDDDGGVGEEKKQHSSEELTVLT